MSDEDFKPTSKALFENHQWRVTAFGMESVRPAPTYKLSADRLLEERDGFYNWPVHVAEKTWVDYEAFKEAFEKALQLHADKFNGAVDPSKLATSMATARQKAIG